MTHPSTLLQRAERLLASSALAALAGTSLAAQADLLTTRDFVVEGSGAYFYNGSGFFADWTAPPTGGAVQAQNPDGSAKFYGSAEASAEQLRARSCRDEPYRYCERVGDRGVALVWWGQFAGPAREGDQIAIDYELSVALPDLGGQWGLSVDILSWAPSNQVGGSLLAGSSLGQGTHDLTGSVVSDALQSWQVDSGEPLYWQVVAYAMADLGAQSYSDFYNSYVYAFGGVDLDVPARSIDVALFNANDPAPNPVPEPATLALVLAGLAGLGTARRRRR